jgi:hypothetical protein
MQTNQIIRRFSSMVDTSGAEPPNLSPARLGGGVYVQAVDAVDDANSLIQGRISLGLIGVLIVGSVGFYYYTRSIQGGG